MASLPVPKVVPGQPKPTPASPADPRDNPSIKQPTAAERAAQEAKFAALQGAPPSLAKLIILVNEHPEWLVWAKESEAGTMRFPTA